MKYISIICANLHILSLWYAENTKKFGSICLTGITQGYTSPDEMGRSTDIPQVSSTGSDNLWWYFSS